MLTALAATGYGRLLSMQEARAGGSAPEADAQLLAYGLAYVDFARTNSALFRLCFGSGYPDYSDPALGAVATEAFERMARGVAAVVGASPPEPDGGAPDLRMPPPLMVDAWRVWALTHGIADLMSAGRMAGLSALPDARRDAVVAAMLRDVLPRP